MLRGAGGFGVALPFIDAMQSTSMFAGPAQAPVRALNIFFGLGIPREFQAEGLSGPLQPLAPLQSKLLIVRGVNHHRCSGDGFVTHCTGARAAFNGAVSRNRLMSGGATLDQALRAAAYQRGLPAGVLPTVLMGTYFRRDRTGRFVHSWNADGSPADLPSDRPEQLFERLFGTLPGPESNEDPAEVRRKRYERSVLDAVVAQYQHYRSDASNLGPASRRRIANHLERIRELERRVFDPTEVFQGGQIPHGNAADPSGHGVDISVHSLVKEWRLMSDLFALGVQSDVIRFGGATFLSAGERIRLQGDYHYLGRRLHHFNDAHTLQAQGAEGCSHEFWHRYEPGAPNRDLRAHIHLILREVTYLLRKLDDPEHCDENGHTILENALVSISTEAGDGRHRGGAQELSHVFHAFSAAGGRLPVGHTIDVEAEGLDLYNTILHGSYGIEAKLGPRNRPYREVAELLG